MHGLFVREVLKRQRDSSRDLDVQAIPRVYRGQVPQKMLQNPEKHPPPDIRIEISNIKFNILHG